MMVRTRDVFSSSEGSAQCPGHGRIVIVDLPEDLVAAMGEGPEVMLVVRIVVLGEGVKGADLLKDLGLILLE